MSLLPARRHFYRKASLLGEAMNPWWLAAIALVVIGTAGVGLFAYKHVELSGDLWWRFAPEAEAPRSLRATVAAAGLLVAGGLTRLLRTPRAEPVRATPAELARAAAVAARSRHTAARRALLGDRALLFSENGEAFIVYAVQGNSRVAVGDPVGPVALAPELVWRFRELCDRRGAWPVFYAVQPSMLPVYLDLGLTALEVGEEARVPLEAFALEGQGREGLSDRVHRVEREGAAFEVDPAGHAAFPGELRAASDARAAGGPVALVRLEGQIVACAKLWLGAEAEEVSADVVRYPPPAPDGLMDYLFARLMLWGRAEGYRWFNLGMAPLAGRGDRALAPLWTRAGPLLFPHGEPFARVQEVRAYKAQFDPVWEARYLAAPSGLALPRVLADVAAAVARPRRGAPAG